MAIRLKDKAKFGTGLNTVGTIDGLTLAGGGITGTNYNIGGVNQLTIADPGEGIVFTGTNNVTLAAIDDAADNIMNFAGAAELRVDNVAVLTSTNAGSYLKSDAADSFSGILTGTSAGENLKVGGIRGTAKGSQTGQYIHLYERVHIGGPSGWGAAAHGAPASGLSTWGSVDFGMNGSGVIQLDGTTIVTAARGLTNVTLPYTSLSGTVPTWNQNTTGNAATATSATNSTQLNGYTLARIDNAEAFHTLTALNASGGQAKRYHIGRLYGCPAHWDGNWQNLEIRATAESYESGHMIWRILGDYGGAGTQAGMMDLYLKEATGPMCNRFNITLGAPVDAGWDHSGQDTYYVDLYADAAYYSQWEVNIKTYGHGTQNSNPTSGGATTVIYDSPTSTNISDFNLTHASIKHLGYEMFHTGHVPTYSELGTMAHSNLTGVPSLPTDFVSRNSGGIFSGAVTVDQDLFIKGTGSNGNSRILLQNTNSPAGYGVLRQRAVDAQTVAGQNSHTGTYGWYTIQIPSGYSNQGLGNDIEFIIRTGGRHHNGKTLLKYVISAANGSTASIGNLNGVNVLKTLDSRIVGSYGGTATAALFYYRTGVANNTGEVIVRVYRADREPISVVEINPLGAWHANSTTYTPRLISHGFATDGGENTTRPTANLTAIALQEAAWVQTTASNGKLNIAAQGPGSGTAHEIARFVNVGSAAVSSYIYIGASSGTDWRLGKNINGTAGNSNFGIAKHSGTTLALEIDSSNNATFTGTIYASGNNSTEWSTAYQEARQWNGGSTNLTASTGRVSLGATTIGDNMFTLANPSAVTFPRFNADNTVTSLASAPFRNAIGAAASTALASYLPLTGGTISGTLTLESGGANTYGRIRGYANDNHFITIRGVVGVGTSVLSISGGHRTTFVEHADDASEGWYFVSKASGNYTEMARIDGVGQMYIGGNKVWHQGNDGAGTGLDADTVDGNHANYNYGVGKTYDITLYGDTDKYYPVVISGGSAVRTSRISVYRSYSEHGPNDWNNSTHKGGLTLDYEMRFGGWGGYPNMLKVINFGEIYSRLCGGIDWTAHTMKHVIWLRGGGTAGGNYHIESPMGNLTIEVNSTTTASNYVDNTSNGKWYSYEHSNAAYQVFVYAKTQAEADVGGQNLIKKMGMRYNGTFPHATSLSVTNTINAATLGGNSASVFANASSLSNYALKGNVSTNTPSSITTFTSNNDGNSTAGDQSGLQIYNGTAQEDAFMTFHISGDYAGQFGLDGATNDLFWGGWSVGNAKYKVYHAGNLTLGTLNGLSVTGKAADSELLDGLNSTQFLRSDAQDTYTPKRLDIGASSSWDNVGFAYQTNLHLQGHGQFWIGAGNATWFAGTANTKSSTSGLAADASNAHDLLITTMQATSTCDRGITFAVDTGGSGTTGYRLGKWHSSNEQHSSKLTIDGGLHVRGGDMANFDYYGDDYSSYWDNQGGQAYWGGDTGWIDPSITAGNAIQIQAGNSTTHASNPSLQFHQYGYGGIQMRYDGPNDRFNIEATAANRMTWMRIQNAHGYIDFGPANTSYAHIYTDRPIFYFNKGINFSDGTIVNSTSVTSALIRSTGDVVAYYSSDKRLKDNIIPIGNAIDKIKQLGGYEFDWNDNQTTFEGHDYGVIAQEVEKVFPELVKDREDGYKGVRYEKLAGVLIEGIKEQQGTIEKQQKQIDELKEIVGKLINNS